MLFPYFDPRTSPSFTSNEEYSGVQTASQEELAVESQVQITGVNGVLCSGAGASFISLGHVCAAHDANCLIEF